MVGKTDAISKISSTLTLSVGGSQSFRNTFLLAHIVLMLCHSDLFGSYISNLNVLNVAVLYGAIGSIGVTFAHLTGCH